MSTIPSAKANEGIQTLPIASEFASKVIELSHDSKVDELGAEPEGQGKDTENGSRQTFHCFPKLPQE